jgi:hypothetical protein
MLSVPLPFSNYNGTAGFRFHVFILYVDYLMWPRQTTNTRKMDLSQKRVIIDCFLFWTFFEDIVRSICMEPGAFLSTFHLLNHHPYFDRNRLSMRRTTHRLSRIRDSAPTRHHRSASTTRLSLASNQTSVRCELLSSSGGVRFTFTSHINGAPLYITACVLLCSACTKHLALQLFQDLASSVSFWLGWSLLDAFTGHLPFLTGFCYCNGILLLHLSLACAFFPLLRTLPMACTASKQAISCFFLDLEQGGMG